MTGLAGSGMPLPSSETRSSALIDGSVWDGRDPAAHAASFAARSRA